jgi:hypothetical protein
MSPSHLNLARARLHADELHQASVLRARARRTGDRRSVLRSELEGSRSWRRRLLPRPSAA